MERTRARPRSRSHPAAAGVTERETNVISVFTIQSNGTLSGPVTTPSVRPAPFGFNFAGPELIVVSEPDPKNSSASSYHLDGNMPVQPISEGIVNGQGASCWVTVAPSGGRAYISNTESSTLSTYAIDSMGMLTLRQAAVPTDGMGSGPIDSDISASGQMFFVLLGGKGTIAVYRTSNDGHLALLGVRETGLPMLGTQGLAVLNR